MTLQELGIDPNGSQDLFEVEIYKHEDSSKITGKEKEKEKEKGRKHFCGFL